MLKFVIGHQPKIEKNFNVAFELRLKIFSKKIRLMCLLAIVQQKKNLYINRERSLIVLKFFAHSLLLCIYSSLIKHHYRYKQEEKEEEIKKKFVHFFNFCKR